MSSPTSIALRHIFYIIFISNQHRPNFQGFCKVIRFCNILCNYFRSSHIGASLLENAIKEKAIKGGGIKLYVQTR